MTVFSSGVTGNSSPPNSLKSTSQNPNVFTWGIFVAVYTFKSGVIPVFSYLVSEVSILLFLIERCDTVS